MHATTNHQGCHPDTRKDVLNPCDQQHRGKDFFPRRVCCIGTRRQSRRYRSSRGNRQSLGSLAATSTKKLAAATRDDSKEKKHPKRQTKTNNRAQRVREHHEKRRIKSEQIESKMQYRRSFPEVTISRPCNKMSEPEFTECANARNSENSLIQQIPVRTSKMTTERSELVNSSTKTTMKTTTNDNKRATAPPAVGANALKNGING